MRYGDGVGLTGPDSGFRISESLARAWFSLDGRTQLDPKVPQAAFDKLVAVGAVDLPGEAAMSLAALAR